MSDSGANGSTMDEDHQLGIERVLLPQPILAHALDCHSLSSDYPDGDIYK